MGYSHYDDTKTEEEVAQVAMQEHLGLRPDQYELDPAIRLSNITKVLISKSNGVKTEYTFSLRVAKSIKVPLNTQDTKKFKWFTWDQILQRKGENGEVIMESTLAIMSNLGNLESIPQCVFPENYWLVEPRESKQYTKLRLTVRDFIITGLIWLIAYVFIFQPFDLINKLSSPIPFISNLAGIIQIVGYFLPITTLPKTYQIIKGYIGPGKTLNKK